MADQLTTGPGFTKPEVGGSDSTWGQKLNGNFDALAAEFTKTFAGNPNGFVAGNYVGQSLWDSVNQKEWRCKTAGNTGSAVWVDTGGFPTDTKQPFIGIAAAPEGWAIDTTSAYNNAALRIVNSAPGAVTGGSVNFTDLFGGATGSYTLLAADIPAHVHGLGSHTHTMAHTHTIQAVQSHNGDGPSGGPNTYAGPVQGAAVTSGVSTPNTGAASGNTDANVGGGGHSHSIGALKYIDAAICKHL